MLPPVNGIIYKKGVKQEARLVACTAMYRCGIGAPRGSLHRPIDRIISFPLIPHLEMSGLGEWEVRPWSSMREMEPAIDERKEAIRRSPSLESMDAPVAKEPSKRKSKKSIAEIDRIRIMDQALVAAGNKDHTARLTKRQKHIDSSIPLQPDNGASPQPKYSLKQTVADAAVLSNGPMPFEVTRYGRHRRKMMENRKQRQIRHKSRFQLKYRQRADSHTRFWSGALKLPPLPGQQNTDDYILPVRVATPPPDFSLFETMASKKSNQRKKMAFKYQHKTDPPTTDTKRSLHVQHREETSSISRGFKGTHSEMQSNHGNLHVRDRKKDQFRQIKIRQLQQRKLTNLARQVIKEALASPRERPLKLKTIMNIKLDPLMGHRYTTGKSEAEKTKRKKPRRRTKSYSDVFQQEEAPRRTSRIKDSKKTKSYSDVFQQEGAPRRTSRIKDTIKTHNLYEPAVSPPRFAVRNWNPLNYEQSIGRNRKQQDPSSMVGPKGSMKYHIPIAFDSHVDYL